MKEQKIQNVKFETQCSIRITLKKNFVYFFCFYTKPKQPVNPIKDWVTLIVWNCVVIHGSLSLLDVLNNDNVCFK